MLFRVTQKYFWQFSPDRIEARKSNLRENGGFKNLLNRDLLNWANPLFSVHSSSFLVQKFTKLGHLLNVVIY